MAVLAMAGVACSGPAHSAADAPRPDRQRAVDELQDATLVVDAMRDIPHALRVRARCVAVIPSLVRAGLVVGARHGDGVVTCRTGAGWSGPLFVSVNGGSAGAQVGVESSDVILLVMSDRGMTRLFQSSFSLGADASVAAGPVGEGSQAGTDASLTAEILSYARSRGLFAGAELSGTAVKQDESAVASLYGPTADSHAILAGEVPAPPEASSFLARIASAFPDTR
jgi:lipid-binding SYLF domain-containing protein